MTPIPSLNIEIAVLVLGILMLLAESFSTTGDRSWLARGAILVLSALVGFSCFVDPHSGNSALVTGFCSAAAGRAP